MARDLKKAQNVDQTQFDFAWRFLSVFLIFWELFTFFETNRQSFESFFSSFIGE